MNLVIDIGNTLTKIAIFSKNQIIFNNNYDSLTLNELKELLNKFNIVNSIIAEVKFFDASLIELLLEKTNFFKLNQNTKLPFNNKYTTPNTLGKDRIAVISAASKLYPNTNVLVIDIGTCITFDIIDADNNYLGGAISPGLEMRFKSLQYFTGKLPLVKLAENNEPQFIGDSTENSIKSGVYYGIKHEIQSIINTYTEQYADLKIVLTGGNAERFELASKNRIFADKFFVLKGLNEILNENAKI
ncbi:MAG: type III pantothenate kinase [Flavobacteriales bacterium]|nr:type III pantothenate kinase [Flavobacteriales bacterium]MCB9363706.1 type III pantothenate kinase [Flavobacteriales bacterium]